MSFTRPSENEASRVRGARARAATEVRRQLWRFFDWSGYSDCRRRAAWADRATRQVLDGGHPDDVVEGIKRAWFAYRKAAGLPLRIPQTSPECGVAMLGVISEILSLRLSPAAAAVGFRGVARDFPRETAPGLVVAHCERLGERWDAGEYESPPEPPAPEQESMPW